MRFYRGLSVGLVLSTILWVTLTVVLFGCGGTPAQQQTALSAASTAIVTLADIAGANNTTVAGMVSQGALFCKKVTVLGPSFVALADLSGAPVSVINQPANDVMAACNAAGGVPVSPPSNPATAAVVQVPTVLPSMAVNRVTMPAPPIVPRRSLNLGPSKT